MKSRLTHNIGLKIVSLVISVLLWAIVNSISDPAVSQTFYNVPVQLLNIDAILDSNQVYEVLDGTNVIPRVTIKAARSVLSEIDNDDIVATADVLDLSSLDTISIKLTTTKHQDKILNIDGSIDTVKLNIENRVTKTLRLSAETKGTPAEGYQTGEIRLEQNQVRLDGAESIVDSVSKAMVEIDVSGFAEDIDTDAVIWLYDENGDVVDSDRISLNMKKVDVFVAMLKAKAVPVNFSITGEPANGYAYTGDIETDKQTVMICGDSSVVNEMEELTIPSDVIDISELKDDYTTTVDIKQYLPAGVTLTNDESSIITVTVHIEPETSKHITINTEDISIVNVPEEYKATVGIDENTIVDIIGLAGDISALNKESINPVVDVKDYMNDHGMESIAEGFYNVPVAFTLPNGVRIVDGINATLHIVKE